MAAPPPDLMEEMVEEILLRCPPDDPARLVRAAVGCKRWRRILSSRGFLRRYRELHRAPPLLGFFHKSFDFNTGASTVCVPTTTPSPLATPAFDFDHAACHVRDCRHGRALMETVKSVISPGKPARSLIVWDRITAVQTKVPLPCWLGGGNFTAAVLCGVDGCDHLHCHGGPFIVVFMAPIISLCGEKVWSWIYSSEAGAWGVKTSHHLDLYEELSSLKTPHGVLAGDALFFKLEGSKGILKYDLDAQGISVINLPPVDEVQNAKMVLVTMEDGGLGITYMVGYNLHLWSCQIGHNGSAGWSQHRVVKLKDSPLPVFIDGRPREVHLLGFAEDAHIIFFSIGCAGIFTFDLKSSWVKKVYDKILDFFPILPFLSFCSPALGAACAAEGSGAGALCMKNSCSGASSSKRKWQVTSGDSMELSMLLWLVISLDPS